MFFSIHFVNDLFLLLQKKKQYDIDLQRFLEVRI